MKKILSVFLCIAMALSLLTACGAKPMAASVAGTYDYEFDGMMGKETLEFVLADDGTVQMTLPGNTMITDTYAGTYSVNEDGTVAISGLKNTDSASPYAIPGLWDWIDSATGNAVIELHSDGTFTPAGAASDQRDPQGESAALNDIAYAGNSNAQKLDIMLPEGEGPFPLVILVHGGGFAMGDKQMPLVQNLFCLVEQGYAVATVNYRLSAEAAYPAAIADVKAAVRFLRANAADYKLDADRFAIWGESAGAYLAVMTAVTDDTTLTGDVAENRDVSSSVKVLLDFYGPITFFQMDEDFAALGMEGATNTEDSFESKFMGKSIAALDEATKAQMSPLTYLTADTALKVWIQAGDADANVPYMQSVRLADAFQAAIGEQNVQFSIVKGAAHMDDAFYTEENLAAVAEFLRNNL